MMPLGVLPVFIPHRARGRSRKPADPRAVAIICGGLALLLGGVGGYLARRNHRVRTEFQPVQATITRSEVGTKQARAKRGRRKTVYFADIKFSYSVGGIAYHDGRFDLMQTSDSGRDSKHELVRRYPAGSTQTAWYDPADPSVAVLCRDFEWLGPLILTAGGVPGVIAALAVLRIRAKRRGWGEMQRATAEAHDDHRRSDDFNAPPPPPVP